MNSKELNLFLCFCSLFLTLTLGYSIRSILDTGDYVSLVPVAICIGVLLVFSRHTYANVFHNVEEDEEEEVLSKHKCKMCGRILCFKCAEVKPRQYNIAFCIECANYWCPIHDPTED